MTHKLWDMRKLFLKLIEEERKKTESIQKMHYDMVNLWKGKEYEWLDIKESLEEERQKFEIYRQEVDEEKRVLQKALKSQEKQYIEKLDQLKEEHARVINHVHLRWQDDVKQMVQEISDQDRYISSIKDVIKKLTTEMRDGEEQYQNLKKELQEKDRELREYQIQEKHITFAYTPVYQGLDEVMYQRDKDSFFKILNHLADFCDHISLNSEDRYILNQIFNGKNREDNSYLDKDIHKIYEVLSQDYLRLDINENPYVIDWIKMLFLIHDKGSLFKNYQEKKTGYI